MMQALLLFRGVVGVGLGGVPVVYTLFTEFCPTDRRGLWLVVLQVRSFRNMYTAGAQGQKGCTLLSSVWAFLWFKQASVGSASHQQRGTCPAACSKCTTTVCPLHAARHACTSACSLNDMMRSLAFGVANTIEHGLHSSLIQMCAAVARGRLETVSHLQMAEEVISVRNVKTPVRTAAELLDSWHNGASSPGVVRPHTLGLAVAAGPVRAPLW